MTRVKPTEAIRRAVALIAGHPQVDWVDSPVTDPTSRVTSVDVVFKVNLHSQWKRKSESPSGVRSREVIRFEFPAGYPLYSPVPSLREDFNRNLPHIQPWTMDGRPVPCIYEGDLTELLHRDGLAGIINQTSMWLEKAAIGTLIDPAQGWEPVRRDRLNDVIVADAEFLQCLIDRRGAYRFLKFNYLKSVTQGSGYSIYGQVFSEEVKVNPKSVQQQFFENNQFFDPGLCYGISLALIAWPGKHPSGKPIVCEEYLPETVENIGDLKGRAIKYGCAKELDSGLRWLKQCVSDYPEAGPFPMPVIFLVRRPFNLIGSGSSIEICPYIVEIRLPDLFSDKRADSVRVVTHRHAICRTLLAGMAGMTTTNEHLRWTLVGAGSLGSKIALHLARAGNGPEVIVDRSGMSPHNAARHALVPMPGHMQIFWMDAKARMLSQALRGLNYEVKATVADAVGIAKNGGKTQGAWSKKSQFVVNATASLAVREAFAASESIRPRVVETSLFAGGRLGVITVEGPDCNPSTTDLMVEFYAMLTTEPNLSSIVFDDGTMLRQDVGHGCGSLTMVMSDGRLSLFAAGMAEYLLNSLDKNLPDKSGEIVIGQLSGDGLGVEWRAEGIPPVTVLKIKNGSSWRVHLHQRARSKMRMQTEHWPNAETGGVIMGRLSEVSKVAHIVDVLEAPEDSQHSADEFTLGKNGLLKRFEDYSTPVDWSLYCLGTWHSHLSSGGPSSTDRAMAKAVSLQRLAPSIFLIVTQTGFEAFMADEAYLTTTEVDLSTAAERTRTSSDSTATTIPTYKWS
ncbi:MAG: ThiF family adenylyltransferase [Gammaproteobacteria bacterium]|nr:ThiF family adenylyltransferase [Gammaproteobacteria bacterium]